MMESWTGPLVLEKPGVAQAFIDQCYMQYFNLHVLQESKKCEDFTTYNMQLRLQDFASIVEDDNTMQAGDIGRAENMWKR